MPPQVFQLRPQHVMDDLDHAFVFEGLGTGDNIDTFTVTVPGTITQSVAASKSAQTVTVWLQGTAGTHRIIVDVVSVAGREARIEADIVISDPA
jgi:hypothetical protein